MKQQVNFTVEEELWARCQEIKRKIKVNWSGLVEEFLYECVENIEEYPPETMNIFQKPNINLENIAELKLEAFKQMYIDIEKETHRMSKRVKEIKKETDEILEYLEKRKKELESSGKKEIDKENKKQ